MIRDERTSAFGQEASSRAAALLVGEHVRVSYDPTQGRTDRYGRTLAYLWLDGGPSFQWQLLRDGYAAEYTYDQPYRYRSEFRAAERRAREADRGLWAPSTCGGDLDRPASSPPTTGGPRPGGPFQSCAAAREAGAAPVHEGEAGYRPDLDGDADGVACE